jgi:RNA polymerase sigma factor (sigma-70 family)
LTGRTATERCFLVAATLNQSHQWGLSSDELRRYAEQLTAICLDIAPCSEERLRTVICNFHADHALVAALRDCEHPQHAEQWNTWSRQVVRLIASRLRHDGFVDIATISYEDLAQEVLSDIWLALPGFRYESRLQTWIFTVIGNRIARSFRTANTRKRRPPVGARSLDAQGDDEQLDYPSDDSIEEVAMAASLQALLSGVLAEHPDTRLQVVFHLWLNEDQPLRVIGNRLNLSIPRVHALLNHALTILRSEQRVRAWEHHGD